MILELNEEERLVIMDLVTTELKELPSEIRHTDSAGYRDQLRERQRWLKQLRERLGAPLEV